MIKEGSLSLDKDGRIIRFAHSLEEMTGFSPEEMYGKDFSSLAPLEAEDEFRALLKAESGVSAKKTAVLCRDGGVVEVYISVYPLRHSSGELYSYMVTLSGKKNEAPPAILTDEFRRFFKFSNDAVAVTDREGLIIDVNQAFLDIYKYERREVLGRNPRALKSGHSTDELYRKMWKDILDPAKCYWKGEIINLAKDGTEVPVLLSINAVKDANGEIKNFLGIAFDMTRQKELERLRKMYIDYIVHDIRGPLTSIMVNSELLQMQHPDLPDKSRKKLDVICVCSQKINAMTTDMLDYSRAQSGNLAVMKEKLILASVLKESFMPFEGSEKRLFLNGVPYPGAPMEDDWLFADRDKFQRIIFNLLSNAFKHAASEVSVTAEFMTGGLKLTISDDGKGVTSREAERIFDAFYQTEDGVKTGGAGLGLNIVKSFVEAHGGHVWVEAGGEKGVTFCLLVPVSAQEI